MNTSLPNTINSPLVDPSDPIHICLPLQTCETCLSPSLPVPCSWCATSQLCVPNTHFPYPFGIFAPIKHEDICPMAWRERWEMRARPFSCRASSMTVLSVCLAVLGTLVGVGVGWGCVRVGRRLGRRVREWMSRRKVRRDGIGDSYGDGEREALLQRT